jgi:predicted ATP-dependent serine protease
MDLTDLDYSIHCRLPGDSVYRNVLGLPLAMALIASYIQRAIPTDGIYLGEIDLLRQVRQVPSALVRDLCSAVAKGLIKRPVTLYLPAASVPAAAEGIGGLSGVKEVACHRLEDAVYATWPDLRPAQR